MLKNYKLVKRYWSKHKIISRFLNCLICKIWFFISNKSRLGGCCKFTYSMCKLRITNFKISFNYVIKINLKAYKLISIFNSLKRWITCINKTFNIIKSLNKKINLSLISSNSKAQSGFSIKNFCWGKFKKIYSLFKT